MTGRWFSADTLIYSTNKTDHHDITEILLKVTLNTINQPNTGCMTLDINHLINQIVPFEPLFIPIANMDNHRTGIMYSNILFGLAILEKINIG